MTTFTPEHAARFDALQTKLAPLWRLIGRTDPGGAVQDENTLVVLSSLTGEFGAPGIVQKVYEERFLFMTFLLRQPNLRLIYLTSQPVAPLTIDYYLHNLPDVTVSHARKRLHLLSPQDGSNASLVEKVLARPWFVRLIRDHIPDADRAHLVPFLTTDLERELALQLGIPMYAADPRHFALGGKSGARRVFAEEGLRHPPGVEDLSDEAGFVAAIVALRAQHPAIGRVITKHNQGVSGEGNAVVDLRGLPPPGGSGEAAAVTQRLRAMRFENAGLTYDAYMGAMARQGGIVEEMIDGAEKRAPACRCASLPSARSKSSPPMTRCSAAPAARAIWGPSSPPTPPTAA